jgi:hypothetical protein
VNESWPEARKHATHCTVQWAFEGPSDIPEAEFVRRGFDKRGWPRGPWDDEPDHVVFASNTKPRFRCLVLRDAESGAFGGYVRVVRKHPLSGFGLKEPRVMALAVLNGVSYAQAGPFGGSDWHFGFTSSIILDYCPGFKAFSLHAATDIVRRADLGELPKGTITAADVAEARLRLPELRREVAESYDASRDSTPLRPKYHRYAFVRAETEKLAAQLAALVRL